MCIWGCERLSVPSKPVYGMILQNTVSTKVSVALMFLSRPLCLDKKIANYLIPRFCNFEILSFLLFWWISCLIFLFLGEREMELEYLVVGRVLCFYIVYFHCISKRYFKSIHTSRNKTFIFVSEQDRYLKT